MTMHLRCWLLILVCAITTTPCTAAQPPAPSPPTKYKVLLRYLISSPRDQHVIQYDSLIAHLKRYEFEFKPPFKELPDTDREDRTQHYLKGYIASDKVLKLLEHPAVQSLLLTPAQPDEFNLPDGPDDPVLVRLELTGGLLPESQREFVNQTRVLLQHLGFKESPGHDHRGYTRKPYTRLVGTVPNSKLDILQRDLRNYPTGWLAPVIPREEIPTPLRLVNPIQIIEVLPDKEAITYPPAPEPRLPEFLDKISSDLWDLIKEKDVKSEPIRVQVVFVGNISSEDRDWKLTLSELAPGFFVESQFGQFVTGVINKNQIKALAESPLISVIRLPRLPYVHVDPGIKIRGDNQKVLAQTGLKDFHKRGNQGKGVRIAIIDRDFRGWESLVKKKLLPAKTRLVDLTIEMVQDIKPLPPVGDEKQMGHGTLCAQAAALAAPQAELVLVRVDVGEPHQLYDVVRYIQGGRESNLMEQRNGELVAKRHQLDARRADLLKERRVILEDFTDETDLRDSLEFLGPLFAWLYSDREWHRKRMEYHEKLEEEHTQRERRYQQLLTDVTTLKGIPIVVNALTWNSSYPLGAISPLSKALDDPQKGPLWFQAVGNVRGQGWLGPYLNLRGDPAMKFTDDAVKLPKNRWSNTINFLAWQPYKGELKVDLPADAKLRFTMQWREPHDPEYYLREDEDLYRRPLADLHMQLLRQRDPKKLPADLFEMVARSWGLPERLEHLPSGSLYEHVLEVPVKTAGRYALRIEKQPSTQWKLDRHPVRETPTFKLEEGLAPTGIRPLGVPTLPAFEKKWELRPRIFVEVIDEPTRLQGRAIFMDYATEAGVIGLPADARNVISVGAATLKNKPQPYSAYGSPPLMELARRPWLYAYDELELAGSGAFGTSIANAFAAGTTATLFSSGQSRTQVLQWLRSQEGQVLQVPAKKK